MGAMHTGEDRASEAEPGVEGGPTGDGRPRVEGKFLWCGGEKYLVRGVTYGPFGPEGREFGLPGQVERDFRLMARNGINAVRTYSTPPSWLLDLAQRHALRVMVGLAWEQHVAFLEDPEPARHILARVREEVGRIQGHPAILCYAVGNEIPAPIVRWHGRRRVVAFLERLCREVKALDPEGLVTYVNYPTTEYLADLPFLDFLAFNVYLEREADLRAYVARLQNLAGDRPLLMAELGLDAAAHGEAAQARALQWQIRAAFEGACAGAMVFAWTDQWHRGGEEVTGWSFGITTRERRPKPALEAVARAFAGAPFQTRLKSPRISVVVCTYNGSATVGETLEHLSRLRYPDYEVIVVDDGSTDDTAEVVAGFDVRLIRTPNRGLSHARNVGLARATGEIVAYIDDDAFPDPDWLTFLAAAFEQTDHAGVGGPNIPPADEGFVSRCVARAPGGPLHVLVSDAEAEHLPGCNVAFRVDRLRAIGGFDPRFRVAGDDVDVCWRLQERGWTLGFTPGAVVWHRRRRTVGGYWRQQRGYGRAEAMLERKWPEKYNSVGHVSWTGRLYNGSLSSLFGGARRRIYQGMWGMAPFQSVEDDPPGMLSLVAAMPESWLLLALLGSLGLLGPMWSPLRLGVPLALLAASALVCWTARAAWKACRYDPASSPRARLRSVALTFWLHLVHPVARLTGRLSSGLVPWRRYVPGSVSGGLDRTLTAWSETWRPHDWWVESVERGLRRGRLLVGRGGEYDRWDLEVRSGALVLVRVLAAVEEHGRGRQLARFRLRSRWGAPALLFGGVGALLATAALFEGAWAAALALGGATLLVVVRCLQEHAAVVARARSVIQDLSAGGASVTPFAPRRLRRRPAAAVAAGSAPLYRNGTAPSPRPSAGGP